MSNKKLIIRGLFELYKTPAFYKAEKATIELLKKAGSIKLLDKDIIKIGSKIYKIDNRLLKYIIEKLYYKTEFKKYIPGLECVLSHWSEFENIEFSCDDEYDWLTEIGDEVTSKQEELRVYSINLSNKGKIVLTGNKTIVIAKKIKGVKRLTYVKSEITEEELRKYFPDLETVEKIPEN